MNAPYGTRGSLPGQVGKSGTPSEVPFPINGARGLILSGVVTCTYVQLDGDPAFEGDEVSRIRAVYCDVITYSTKPNLHGIPLRRVLVADASGIHSGRVWKPRAARLSVDGKPLDARTLDPSKVDGDHVLIQFIDDNMARPVITSRMPHPLTGLGNEELPQAGHRQLLKVVDGIPEYLKHNGTFFGVSDTGDFILNTTRANDGDYDDDGSEPQHVGGSGNIDVRMNKNQIFRLQGLDPDQINPNLLVQVSDGDIQLRLVDTNTTVRIHRANGGTGQDLITLDVNDADGDAHFELKKNSLVVQMPSPTAAFNVNFGGATFSVTGSGPTAALTLGSGNDNAVLYTELAAWWARIQTVLTAFITAFNVTATATSTATFPGVIEPMDLFARAASVKIPGA
jgi:hypothetical protein